MAISNKEKDITRCQRCGGKMIFEKFYDVNSVFYGWHCVICGEILDPVILLHRLSQDADIKIPEEKEEVIHLLKKYLGTKPKSAKETSKVKGEKAAVNLKDEPSLN